ncbi:hypothetical protein [Flavobacterium sp.]
MKIALVAAVVFIGIAVIIDRVFDVNMYGPLGGSAGLFYWFATRKK